MGLSMWAWTGKAKRCADAFDQAVDRIGRERAAALGGEDEGAVGELLAQLAQDADLVAAERMGAGLVARRTWSASDRPSSTWAPLEVGDL
jgi:hypothetical protein